MKAKDLVKKMQSEFDSGESLQDIYHKNKSDSIKEKTLASLVGTLKDQALIKKYKIPNNVLVGLMVLTIFLSAFAGYVMGLELRVDNPIYGSAIAIIPMIFTYAFIQVNFQAYLVYLILTISQFSNLFKNLGADPVWDVVTIVITISIWSLVLYVKTKMFPYMGFIGAKKNADKEYLVAVQNKEAA